MGQSIIRDIGMTSGLEPKISIVCPAYQEEEVLPLFHEALGQALDRLSGYRFEVIYVDDGSSDGTLDCLRKLSQADPRVFFLSLSRNQGHQVALIAGLQHAQGEAVISMDADLQHPPELIGELLERWRKGAQVVQTIRENTEDATWFKNWSSKTFYRLLEVVCDSKLPVGAADYRLMDRVALDGFLQHDEPRPFIRGIISRMGFRAESIPYKAEKRAAGVSKFSLPKMFHLALDAYFSYSLAPARIAFPIAFALGALGLWALSLAFWNLYQGGEFLIVGIWLLTGTMAGCTAFILLTLGLLGEYLGRIFYQVRRRPLFMIKEKRLPLSLGAQALGAQGNSSPSARAA